MIYDRIENAIKYFAKESLLLRAIQFAEQQAAALENGDHWLEEGVVKALLQAYETSPAEERFFERHRKFIDVQVMIKGMERHDVTQAPDLVPNMEYDEKMDLIKFENPERFSTVILEPGYFVVYFPQDAHRPGCTVGSRESVRKVCMKVKASPAALVCLA